MAISVKTVTATAPTRGSGQQASSGSSWLLPIAILGGGAIAVWLYMRNRDKS